MRIVERGIFERELKPLIEYWYSQNKNSDMDDKKQQMKASTYYKGCVMEYKVLNNGLKMPMVGLGVFNISERENAESCGRCRIGRI